MGDSYRASRAYRDRDDSGSEDERYKKTTVTRYKVNSGGGDRYERTDRVVDVEDDRRSHFSAGLDRRTSNDFPAKPRSNFESQDGPDGERSRSFYYERDVERDVERDNRREPDRSRMAVYETKEVDREWDRRSRYGGREDEMRVEKRVEEHFDDYRGHDVDRYRRETEYYTPADPPPAPVIIRQRAPEPQKIIVQEAPSPGVVVLRDRETDREISRRDREPYEEEYYYRHQKREVVPYRGDRDHGLARYDRRRRDDDYHSDDDDYYVHRRRTVIRRESSEESSHHKRHLAEGALAGAGVTALLSSRPNEYGELPENRGRKVIAGAALGALGTEALRRAHSAYEDRFGDRRESPDHHRKLKKGLEIAAVALAAAGAAQYFKSNKIEKEEAHRGRSRGPSRGSRHYHDDDYSRSRSRSQSRASRKSRSRSRVATAAKAVLGTAAAAGIVKHFRNKSKSKSRSRSKSKLRRGAEIAGAAAAAGIAGKMYKNHKEKKEAARDLSSSGEDDYHSRRNRSRTRSRSRSRARSFHSEPGADPELGLVEYGNDPLPPQRGASATRGYESEAEERRRSRRRSRRNRSRSSSTSEPERKRSSSRLRNMAAAGAAAFGIKEYKDKKDREKKERRSRDREDSRRRYDDNGRQDGYFDEHRPHSPPNASGGAYYPPYPSTPGADPGAPGYAPYNDAAYPQNPEFHPYVPQDYTGYAPPPPPGPPPAGPPPMSGAASGYPPAPPGPPQPGPPGPPPPGPPPGDNYPTNHVSLNSHSRERHEIGDADGPINSPYHTSSSNGPPTASKSVSFIPLSPKSSKTMERHRKEQAGTPISNSSESSDERFKNDANRSHNRPNYDDQEASGSSSRRSVDHRNGRHGESSGPDDDGVEDLPSRFDSHGRPLDGRSASHDRWTTRSGQFERRPQRPGDWDIRGAWQVSGTEGEAVDRLVRNVTGALEGRNGWMGVLGQVFGGGLLQSSAEVDEGQEGGRRHSDGDDETRQRRRRRNT